MQYIFKLSGLLIIISFSLFSSCGGPDNGITDDGYNREVLLQEYSSLIQNTYGDLALELDALNEVTNVFSAEKSTGNLEALQNQFLTAYAKWQALDFLNIEAAADAYLVESANTFPCDVDLIEDNIENAITNLEPINQFVAQGFPAIDYILFNGENETVLEQLQNQNRLDYLILLVIRLNNKNKQVVDAWSANYQAFINDSGSDAGSSIAALFNAMVKNFERRTRDAKVGIPAGLRTDNIIQLNQVEAQYAKQNLVLLKENIIAFKSFFNASEIDGFDNYLNYLEATRQDEPLADVINKQFDKILTSIDGFETDLATSIENDKSKAIALFNEMQKLVIYLKVDMAAELGILINYADNDGDS